MPQHGSRISGGADASPHVRTHPNAPGAAWIAPLACLGAAVAVLLLLGEPVWLLAALPPLAGRPDAPDDEWPAGSPGAEDAVEAWIRAFDALPDAVLLVRKGGELRANRRARELFGAGQIGNTLEQWIAGHPLFLSPDGPRCPPDRLPLALALSGRAVEDMDLRIQRSGLEAGHEGIWVSVRARPLLDAAGSAIGAVAAFRDVSRQKIVEATLADHRRRLEQQHQRQSALAGMELAVLEPRELQVVLDRIVQLTERLLPATSAAIVLLSEDGEDFDIASSTAPRHRAEHRVRARGGATRWILDNLRPLTIADAAEDPFHSALLREGGFQAYSGVPLLADGKAIGVLYALDALPKSRSQEELDFMASLAARASTAIGLVRLYDELRRLNASLRENEVELTEHREQLERLVQERTAALRASHERLAVADRLASLGTLTAGLGHDMNNLLFPLRCRLDALDWSTVPADCRHLLRSVNETVDCLQQLTDGLRLFALDPSDPGATGTVTDLAAWWEQVRTLISNVVPDGVTIEDDFAPGLPAVRIAPHQLTQAVLNLVLNAGEAHGHRIRIVALRRDEYVHLSVRDDGIGMSDEVKRRVFDPFFTRKTRSLSTGLGLSLVHGVVRASGGAIDIDTSAGIGTTITLALPVSSAPEPDDDRTGRGVAIVSLADAHAQAWVCRIVADAGFEVRRGDEPGDDECRLWVTDPTDGRVEAARSFLAGDTARRVIVLGAENGSWRRIGAVLLEQSGSLDALRSALT